MKKVGGIIAAMKEGREAPSRHDNPWVREAIELSSVLSTGEELEKSFATLFSDPKQPILMEIGCYMGKNVLELSEQNPKWNILGLDITYKRVAKAARKIHSLNIGNARIGIADARAVLDWMPERALQGVAVFFPDPWPKKRHAKNRLFQRVFFDTLRTRLKPGGFVWIKTDQQGYWEEALGHALAAGFVLEPQHGEHIQPPEIPGGPYLTVFEGIFQKQGIRPWGGILRNPTHL